MLGGLFKKRKRETEVVETKIDDTTSFLSPALPTQAELQAATASFLADMAISLQQRIESLSSELEKASSPPPPPSLSSSSSSSSSSSMELDSEDSNHLAFHTSTILRYASLLSSSDRFLEKHHHEQRETFITKLHKGATAREETLFPTDDFQFPVLSVAKHFARRPFGPSVLYHEIARLIEEGYEPKVVLELVERAYKNMGSAPTLSVSSPITALLKTKGIFHTQLLWALAQRMVELLNPRGVLYELKQLPLATTTDKTLFDELVQLSTVWVQRRDQLHQLLPPVAVEGSGSGGSGGGGGDFLVKIRKVFIKGNMVQSGPTMSLGDMQWVVDSVIGGSSKGVDATKTAIASILSKGSSATSFSAVSVFYNRLTREGSSVCVPLQELFTKLGSKDEVKEYLVSEVKKYVQPPKGAVVKKGRAKVSTPDSPMQAAHLAATHLVQRSSILLSTFGARTVVSIVYKKRAPVKVAVSFTTVTEADSLLGVQKSFGQLLLVTEQRPLIDAIEASDLEAGLGLPFDVLTEGGDDYGNFHPFEFWRYPGQVRGEDSPHHEINFPGIRRSFIQDESCSSGKTGGSYGVVRFGAQSRTLSLQQYSCCVGRLVDASLTAPGSGTGSPDVIMRLKGRQFLATLAFLQSVKREVRLMPTPTTTITQQVIPTSSATSFFPQSTLTRESFAVDLTPTRLPTQAELQSATASFLADMAISLQQRIESLSSELEKASSPPPPPSLSSSSSSSSSPMELDFEGSNLLAFHSSTILRYANLLSSSDRFLEKHHHEKCETFTTKLLKGATAREETLLPNDDFQFPVLSVAKHFARRPFGPSVLYHEIARLIEEGYEPKVVLELVERAYKNMGRAPTISVSSPITALLKTEGIFHTQLLWALAQRMVELLNPGGVLYELKQLPLATTTDKTLFDELVQLSTVWVQRRDQLQHVLLPDAVGSGGGIGRSSGSGGGGVSDIPSKIRKVFIKGNMVEGIDSSAESPMQAAHLAATHLLQRSAILLSSFGARTVVSIVLNKDAVKVAVSFTTVTEADSLLGVQKSWGQLVLVSEQRPLIDAIEDSDLEAGLGLSFDVLTDGGGDYGNFHPFEFWCYPGQVRGEDSNQQETNFPGLRRCFIQDKSYSSGKTGGSYGIVRFGASSKAHSIKQHYCCEGRLVEASLTAPGSGTGSPDVIMRLKGRHFLDTLAFLLSVKREVRIMPKPTTVITRQVIPTFSITSYFPRSGANMEEDD